MSVQWPLILFTLFEALGAGILCLLGVYALMGKDKEIRLPAIICSAVAIALGGCASVLHLHHLERLFNGFSNLTSGITLELVFIVVAFVVLVIYFVFARKDADTPKWVGVLAIAAAVLLVVFMSHSYIMPARPAWDTFLLYAFYLGGAFLFGSLGVMLFEGIKGITNKLSSILVVVAGAVQAVITVAYGVFLTTLGSSFMTVDYYFDSTMPNEAIVNATSTFSSLLTGGDALLFWGGAVIAGAVVPLILGIVGMRAKGGKQVAAAAGVGAVCALAGGVAFRVILYHLGYTMFLFF